MELRQLATFRTVATTLSFTQAAELLDYAQSSVTAQIQALEEELRVRLFERLGKRIALTSAGRRLLPYAEQMLRLAEEAQSIVRNDEEPGGTLIIGSPESLCTYRLPPVLSQFRCRFPKVQVVFGPGSSSDLQRALLEGRLDLAFFVEEPRESRNLVIENLTPEPMLLLTYPDHPLTRLSEVQPHSLQTETMLLTEAGCSYRERFQRTMTQAGAQAAGILEFVSVEAIKQCVMARMGVTFLPAVTVAAEIEAGKLVALPWHVEDYGLYTQVAWHRDKWLSPALCAFLDLCRELLIPR